VCTACAVEVDQISCGLATYDQAEAVWEQAKQDAIAAGATPGTGPDATLDGSVQVDLVRRQVLVVNNVVPAGTTVQQILESPTAWLTARAVPASVGCDTTISTIGGLGGLAQRYDAVVARDIAPGVFLDQRHLSG